ncbi:hypothetical protein I79_018122 [Cricetulus griseus]|uniref:Uncharacterized protein n=1 Tax=Cricetulus griseus TaxID=10029 RepID=G3I3V4_CRIGR|nr:hypothetical protein I79_018122 [Cricetulus griseus]
MLGKPGNSSLMPGTDIVKIEPTPSYHYCSEKAQNGFGAYIQYQTSIRWFEAKSTLKYIVGRGNKVCLPDIQRPEIDYQSHMDTLLGVLNLEKELTKTLQILYDRASTFIDTQDFRMTAIDTRIKAIMVAQELEEGVRQNLELLMDISIATNETDVSRELILTMSFPTFGKQFAYGMDS